MKLKDLLFHCFNNCIFFNILNFVINVLFTILDGKIKLGFASYMPLKFFYISIVRCDGILTYYIIQSKRESAEFKLVWALGLINQKYAKIEDQSLL